MFVLCIEFNVIIIVGVYCELLFVVFFFKQKTAYEMRISDWSSDVCSSDLQFQPAVGAFEDRARHEATDASETVDCDFHCHVGESFLRMGGRCLIVQPFQDLGAIASAVRPKCLNRSSIGAEAPKLSIPKRRPWRPV